MHTFEIMRKGADCPTIAPSAPLSEFFEVIQKAPRRAGAAMVVDEEQTLVGIITQGDFLRFVQDRDRKPEDAISTLMTANPKCVRADERVAEALAMMRQYSIDELPVVDDEGTLVGLIDVQDLISSGFSVFDQV